MLTFIDLFAGIGGFRLGMEQAGAKCVFSSEIDKFAQKTYQENFGETSFGDITKISTKDIPDHDILCAGFPCQSFSIAGKRLGFEDTRGTMFFEIARILKEKQPKAFILENVDGLISHDKGKTFGTILNILAKTINGQTPLFETENLGYHIYYKVLNSTGFGVPQNRKRIFIVGFKDFANFSFPLEKHLTVKLKNVLENDVDDKYFLSEKAIKGLINHSLKQKEKGNTFKANIVDIDDRQMNAILARSGNNGSNLLKITANASQAMRVNSIEDSSVCLQSSGGGQGGKTGLYLIPEPIKISRYGEIKNKQDIASCLTVAGHSGGNHSDMDLLAIPVLAPDRLEKRQNGRRFKDNNDPMFTLKSQDKHGVFDGFRIRRLTPRECARLQGYPDSFKIPVSDSQAYKQFGNSVTVPVVNAIAKNIFKCL